MNIYYRIEPNSFSLVWGSKSIPSWYGVLYHCNPAHWTKRTLIRVCTMEWKSCPSTSSYVLICPPFNACISSKKKDMSSSSLQRGGAFGFPNKSTRLELCIIFISFFLFFCPIVCWQVSCSYWLVFLIYILPRKTTKLII